MNEMFQKMQIVLLLNMRFSLKTRYQERIHGPVLAEFLVLILIGQNLEIGWFDYLS